MITDQQLKVIKRVATDEVCSYGAEPQTVYERAAVQRMIRYGIRVLEATQPDSWEMGAVEADYE